AICPSRAAALCQIDPSRLAISFPRGIGEGKGGKLECCCLHPFLRSVLATGRLAYVQARDRRVRWVGKGARIRSGKRKRESASFAASMSSSSSVNTLQRLVEQLKLEAGVERIRVSQAAAELQQYCMQNACKDALLVGVPAGSNPFREPRSCALL
uniref:Guanine nucleotide-binding protein subunit gamma n=3 Tax=Colubroidea TaxID=34989 RepID=A0A8C6XIC6_NAJNA